MGAYRIIKTKTRRVDDMLEKEKCLLLIILLDN